jgi:hypothetical protein
VQYALLVRQARVSLFLCITSGELLAVLVNRCKSTSKADISDGSWYPTAATRQVLCAPDDKRSNSLLQLRANKAICFEGANKAKRAISQKGNAGRQQEIGRPLASDDAAAGDDGHVARYN